MKYNNVTFALTDKTNTLSIVLSGNINERSPSDIHTRYIVLPLKTGLYTVDFGIYCPKYVFELEIIDIKEDSVEITFDKKGYILKQGDNFLFCIKEYRSSYDGPHFTAVDNFSAYLIN